MNKSEILQIVRDGFHAHIHWYLDHGPSQRIQENYFSDGVMVVKMNVELLEGWLDHGNDGQNLNDAYQRLEVEDRREIWESSGFHYGLGYNKTDSDFYWSIQSRKPQVAMVLSAIFPHEHQNSSH